LAAAFAGGVALAVRGSPQATPRTTPPVSSTHIFLVPGIPATLESQAVKVRNALSLACPSKVSGSDSPRARVYDCRGTVPAGSSYEFPTTAAFASTVLAARSTVTVLSGRITGNFTSCGSGGSVSLMVRSDTLIATWEPAGKVTGLAPSETHTTTLGRSQAVLTMADCIPGGKPPSYSFNIRLAVQPPDYR
jgi:hypothetical protein